MQVLTSGEQTSTFSPGGSVGPGERPRVCVGERSISKSNGVLLFNLKKSILMTTKPSSFEPELNQRPKDVGADLLEPELNQRPKDPALICTSYSPPLYQLSYRRGHEAEVTVKQ
ncbi:hypothetical protein F2P81_000169 [Scophthalmus maximus]|uniref:Uncharacterized protein n=1 Tax=Scophthalmus maximus TaxID=52904 RepID=A0A6A4TG28_SCOMX|nr:hypothetical protein F2P81_000169 [Scophthalmus maximus]